jgi:hypothetical protein
MEKVNGKKNPADLFSSRATWLGEIGEGSIK